MADIFLSYSREDQPTARRFADALAREGFDVWWDQALAAGETFDQVTESALKDAKAVVVLWSKQSVQSRWVRSEAAQADRYGTLVPVMIEPCTRPIMFELTHTVDLSRWKGDADDPAWRAFIDGLRKSGGKGAAGGVVTVPVRRPRQIAITAIAAAAVLAIAAGAFWFIYRSQGTAAAPAAATVTTPGVPVTSVAVLPFENVTGDLGDGFAGELINALAKVQGLQVAARTSSFAYKGRNTDIRQIARDLGVATVIEGTVQSAGKHVRIAAQLVNAESGYQLWSETYDRDFKDLFQLQDELTQQIVAAYRKTMGVDLTFRAGEPPTKNLDAYVLYLRGSSATVRGTDAGFREGATLMEKALALDPGFARAHWLLGVTYSVTPGSRVADVERHIRRANELEPGLGRDLLGSVEARLGHWVAAEEIFRSMQDSREAAAHALHGISLLWPLGQLQNALREMTRSVELAPGLTPAINNVARCLSALGQDAEAIRWAEKAVSAGADPAFRRTRLVYYATALRASRYDEAASMAIELLPEDLRSEGGEAAVRLVHAGISDPARRKAAVAALDGLLLRVTPADWAVKTNGMVWYTQLGALDGAYRVAEELRQQFNDEGPLEAWSWLWAPEMRDFRRDPRFDAFTRELGMTAYWQKYGPPDGCNLSAGKLSCR